MGKEKNLFKLLMNKLEVIDKKMNKTLKKIKKLIKLKHVI